MRHDSTRNPAPAGLFSLACIAMAAAGCGADPVPCDPCPQIGGEYEVDSVGVLGSCEFQPVTLGSTFVLEQTTDTTGLSTSIQDPVSEEQIDLTGEIYNPTEDDPVDVIATFSLTAETVRPATALGTDIVDLLTTMSGSVSDDQGLKKVSGTLTSQDQSIGSTEACRVSITYSAVETTDIPAE